MSETHFSLWDMVTANFVAEFASERDALMFVRGVIEDGQHDLATGWALGWEDRDGNGEQIAIGQQLVERALTLTAA